MRKITKDSYINIDEKPTKRTNDYYSDIDKVPDIELVHINLGRKDVLFELLVNGKTILASLCPCCGDVCLACDSSNTDIAEMYEEDIYEFICSITGKN